MKTIEARAMQHYNPAMRLACTSVLLLWLGCGGQSCGCSGGKILAQLTNVEGAVQRDFAKEILAWTPAEVGAQFRLGDGVRAPLDASAELKLIDGSIAKLYPGALLRFMKAGSSSGGYGIDVQAGEAELVVGSRPLHLTTHLGDAQLVPGTRLRLRRLDNGNIVFTVQLGLARLRPVDGEPVEIGVGQSLEVTIGMAIIGPAPGLDLPEAEPAPEIPAPVDAGTGDGVADASTTADESEAATPQSGSDAPRYEANLARSSVGVPTGETATIHVVRDPVTVGFGIGDKCPDRAVVTVEHARGRRAAVVRGVGRIHIEVPRGRHPYQMACLTAEGKHGPVVAKGTITVVRDSGRARLPRRPPTSPVRADGRTYNVLYQNQLPHIVFTWPEAPAARRYKVTATGRGAPKPASSKKPKYVFKSGKLREGKHTLQFSAGDKRSRETRLVLRFDNNAPRASLAAPRERGFSVGDTVEVRGVAMSGSKVSVAGGEMTVDAQDRFRATVVTTAAHPDLAVRVSHPRRGTHYYVRRAKGSK